MSSSINEIPAPPDQETAHHCRDLGDSVARRLISRDTAGMLAETFRVLGDPSRVRIVHALFLSELCTSDLASSVSMSESAVSHQLRTLRQLQVVRTRREGKLVYYRLHDEHIRRLFIQGLEHVTEPHPQLANSTNTDGAAETVTRDSSETDRRAQDS